METDLQTDPALQHSDRVPEPSGPIPIYNTPDHSPLGRKSSDWCISR